MLRRTKSLKGYHLGAMDAELGHVKDFYFDDDNWHIRYLVADTGKWLPHRKVLISPHAFGSVDDEERVLHIRLTRDQIENSPSIDADKPVSRQFEEEYLRYFGWPFYWSEPIMWGVPTTPTIPDQQSASKGNPHLRSVNEMIGYHLRTSDGDIGHVEDFRVEDADWTIRDLIADTRNWLHGKRVLIEPVHIQRVSWQEARVIIDTNRAAVENLPEYHEEQEGHRHGLFHRAGH